MLDVFVVPSVSETFPNAALEAMSMSCPVLAARTGGMPEMLQFGGGTTYPPGDVRSLCDLIVSLVINARTRKGLGEQARQAAEEHFSFDKMWSGFRERVLDAD
jgi:glycosyltransferase involved in cell wall biosynthesis